ncbi:MAG: glycerol-3-phosphate acyltransferase [Anaerolineales bacterium]|jgi:glycerol-3-phosphate acyltransferase PlsY
MRLVLQSLLSLIIAYLLGSFPSGALVVRLTRGRDIRKWYSGRTGGTNVMRVAGLWAGLATAIGDVLKAFLAVRFARWFSGGSAWVEVLAGTVSIIGHNYSLFLIERVNGKLHFRGGAGGASAFGAAIGLWPPVGLIILGVGAAVYYGIGYASVATMSVPVISGVTFAIRAISGKGPWIYALYGLLAEIFILWALRPNIQRLIAGEERLVGWRAQRQHKNAGTAGEKNGDGNSDGTGS